MHASLQPGMPCKPYTCVKLNCAPCSPARRTCAVGIIPIQPLSPHRYRCPDLLLSRDGVCFPATYRMPRALLVPHHMTLVLRTDYRTAA